jgi:hypothetical protein
MRTSAQPRAPARLSSPTPLSSPTISRNDSGRNSACPVVSILPVSWPVEEVHG